MMSLHGVASSSLLNHGVAWPNRFRGYTRAPAKPCESGVYDGGGACDLLRARGSFIPRAIGGTCRGLCGVH
jgi:hypothetical protein